MVIEMNDTDYHIQRLQSITARFKIFAETVGKILFPWRFESFGLFPDLSKWPKIKAYLYILSNPLIVFDIQSFDAVNFPFPIIATPVLWIAFLFWLLNLGAIFLVGSMKMLNPTSSNVEPSNLAIYIFSAILILFILIMIDTYLHLIYFLISRKIDWKYKIRWFFSFIMVVAMVVVYIKQKFNISSFIFPALVVDKALWLTSIFMFLVPACIVLSAAILLIGWRALQAFGYLLRYIFLSLNNPIPFSDIKKVMLEPNTSESETWRLIDLPIDEIIILRDWARENLEATEKKTIPLAILLAILGLFGNNLKFQNALESFISFLILRPDFDWGQYIFSSIMLMFVSSLVFSFVLLFRNLIIQGIIIQACTLAANIKIEQQKNINSISEKSSNVVVETIKKLLKLFIPK